MPAVQVDHVSKSFGPTQAVADVSFSVERGEILGLLGPNGAGKTTTIRIMLDILKPDHGKIAILGGAMSEGKKNRIGYMPEERGLYQDISLERCLVYLTTLKGLSRPQARRRVGAYLDRFNMSPHRAKKVKELSKGMQQKAQLIATIAHRPELVIIDEPFTALDPVNTRMVKELIRELRDQGTTILMSTHQMHHVEQLCDRILLMDHGRNVLYGPLDEIRRQFGGHAVLVRVAGELPALPGVTAVAPHDHVARLTLAPTSSPQDVLKALVAQDVLLEQYEVALPSLDEIFIRVVEAGGVS
jgi:ABC-2 type transport system ATP-binding protein